MRSWDRYIRTCVHRGVMSEPTEGGGTRFTLDLWHPNCWAIEVTERMPNRS
jgi:hypothetical protein